MTGRVETSAAAPPGIFKQESPKEMLPTTQKVLHLTGEFFKKVILSIVFWVGIPRILGISSGVGYLCYFAVSIMILSDYVEEAPPESGLSAKIEGMNIDNKIRKEKAALDNQIAKRKWELSCRSAELDKQILEVELIKARRQAGLDLFRENRASEL